MHEHIFGKQSKLSSSSCGAFSGIEVPGFNWFHADFSAAVNIRTVLKVLHEDTLIPVALTASTGSIYS